MATERYNWANTECDWCEEVKNCRGIEEGHGVVVLTICEDCDTPTTIVQEQEDYVDPF